MLGKLYKKLHIIFTSSIMLIITLIILFICVNDVNMEKVNESTFFQRMSTLLSYQIEDNVQNCEAVMKEYEDKYNIACTLKDDKEHVLYQSKSSFAANADFLLKKLQKQTTTQEAVQDGNSATTMQGGMLEMKGSANDNYWGIPVLLVAKDGRVYYLSLLYKQKTMIEMIGPNLPFYLLIWSASCISVFFISNFVLKKALEPTEKVLRSQKEFVAAASHELKSPLAVILANAERVEGLNIENSQIKHCVKTIDSECMRMSKLIKDMLLLASSDAGTWTLSKGVVDIDTLLITLYEAYEPICLSRNIELSLNIMDTSYPSFYTDGERVFQILSIYMENAIHHCEHNTSIQIQTKLTSKEITFHIIDHGQGIEEKDKPYIFNRFYCVDRSHTDKSHFGLGLSIASELSEMLNGKAGFKDTEGGGATFYVMLPIK